MTNLSQLRKYYSTLDATAAATDVTLGKIAYGLSGKITGTGPSVDPYFSSVRFLLPDPGIALRLGVTDYGSFITTSPKFGSTSLQTDGSGDTLVATLSASLGTADFTIESWLWPITGGAGANYGRIIQLGPNATNGGLYIVRLNAPNPLQFLIQTYSAGYWTVFSGGGSAANDVWSHFALVREAGDWSLYLNGSRIAQNTGAITGDSLTQTTLYMGTNQSGSEGFNGRFNNTRITAGVARYSGATYTVPTAGFPKR